MAITSRQGTSRQGTARQGTARQATARQARRRPALLCLAHLPLLAGCGPTAVLESYLAIVNISPSSGAADVGLDVEVVATFSEALVDESVSPVSARLQDARGDTVGAATAYDEEMWSVRISPDERLDPGADYVIVLTADLQGVDSGPLPQEVQSSFSTRGPSDGQGSPPLADAGPDQDVAVGDPVLLDASASYDPEGDTLSYLWQVVSLPEGSKATLSDPTDVAAAFFADRTGVYVISLVVNDGLLDSDTDYVQVVAGGT